MQLLNLKVRVSELCCATKMFNVKMHYMKKRVTIAIVQLLILSLQAQNQKIQFIDSISHGINMDNIILPFFRIPRYCNGY
jgi:dimeric dUTPase (all-alpha-NTP-PPase superfamily)